MQHDSKDMWHCTWLSFGYHNYLQIKVAILRGSYTYFKVFIFKKFFKRLYIQNIFFLRNAFNPCTLLIGIILNAIDWWLDTFHILIRWLDLYTRWEKEFHSRVITKVLNAPHLMVFTANRAYRTIQYLCAVYSILTGRNSDSVTFSEKCSKINDTIILKAIHGERN